MSDPQAGGAVSDRGASGSHGSPSPLSAQVRSLRLPTNDRGSSSTSWFAWLLCLILACTSGWLGYRQYLAPASESAPADRTAVQPATDKLLTPDKSAPVGEVALESKGYIIVPHQILVSPQVSGRIVRLNVEEGRRVTKNEVLGEIESIEYAADVSRTQASLELARQHLLELERGNRPEEIQQAQAELSESEAQLKQLEAEWKRSALLVRDSIVTEQDFEVTESRYHAMQRRVDRLRFAWKLMKDGPRDERIQVARAEVKQVEAELIKAQWKLDNCTIRAPISGTILKKNAEEGNIVNPVAFNGSFSICDLADLADLEVSLDIQERDVSRVYPGQCCKVRAEGFPDRIYEGVVSRLMPIADRAKGAIPVRVKLSVPAEEEGVYLKPEMGAVVTFLNSRVASTSPAPAPQQKVTDASPSAAAASIPTDVENGVEFDPLGVDPPDVDPPSAPATGPTTTPAG